MSRVIALGATLLTGALFGFFYAWTITMWGLDSADPASAAASMVAINESVRNALFFAAFAGAPLMSALTAIVGAVGRRAAVAVWFAAATVLLVGAVVITALGNVPLNQSLAALDPAGFDADAWAAYSVPWQAWNVARTVASGAALLCCGAGLIARGRAT